MLRRWDDEAAEPHEFVREGGSGGERTSLQLATCVVQALDWLEPGIALIDDRDRVLFASAGARALLCQRRGITIAGNVLHIASPSAAARLRHLIARCVARTGESGGPPPSCRIGDPALSIAIIPAAAPLGAANSRPMAILVIADPHRSSLPSMQFLRDQFGLTNAQAALTLQVASGKGLKAAAKNLGIGISTARSHLRQVFGKTSTGRQAELVRLVLQAQHHVRQPSP